MKKLVGTALTLAMVIGCPAGCGSSNSGSETTATTAATATTATEAAAESTAAAGTTEAAGSDFDYSRSISVNSREDGSGTRGAFVELLGIEAEDANGEKYDNTTLDANITNSTSVMMTSVAGNPYAIGYISLGSLNDSVKAVKIDGAEATTENVANGSYKVSRPFNIATMSEPSELAQDFISFIMSAEGQAVVEENGYIKVDTAAAAYAGSAPEGTLTVGGSSSVSPVMEKLAEAYKTVNPNASIELQTSDSTTGMTSAMEGNYDIGMASRELKDSETEGGLVSTTIALDGIAVIVNNENPVDDLTSEQVQSIYVGDTTSWADVQ